MRRSAPPRWLTLGLVAWGLVALAAAHAGIDGWIDAREALHVLVGRP